LAQLRLSIYQKKNIKSSKVQTKNDFELNLIELFFDFEFGRFVFLRKKKYDKQIGLSIKL